MAIEPFKQHSHFPNESTVAIISPFSCFNEGLSSLLSEIFEYLCRICSGRSSGKCPQGGNRSRKVSAGIHIAKSMLSADRWRRMLTLMESEISYKFHSRPNTLSLFFWKVCYLPGYDLNTWCVLCINYHIWLVTSLDSIRPVLSDASLPEWPNERRRWLKFRLVSW